MYTISQVDVNRLMDKAASRAKNTEDIIRRFVFESCYMTSFFRQNDIWPLSWEKDEELIERNQLVVAVNKWFQASKKCDSDLDFPRPSKGEIWTLIREYWESLIPYMVSHTSIK